MAQINKPSDYFEPLIWTGTGTTQNITTTESFAPDFVWIKRRNSAEGHALFDTIRGATNRLFSNTTGNEATSSVNQLDVFNSDGYTLGGSDSTNASGSTYVSWNWLAGGTASSNTDGSITSSVSANTTSGFSIVSYTGTGSNATVGHGLGVAPSMIIVKNRTSGVEHWHVLHKSLNTTSGEYMLLSATNAVLTNSVVWNNTAPTSSVFSIGTAGGVNGSGNSLIAYCFSEKKGFSKFGLYTGNGSTDGTFVYTGFKPAWLMIKRTDTTSLWTMKDNKRNTYNPQDSELAANTSDAENTPSAALDFYSNGFKLKGNFGNINTSGSPYIYMAFAENPLVGTNNIPACAR